MIKFFKHDVKGAIKYPLFALAFTVNLLVIYVILLKSTYVTLRGGMAIYETCYYCASAVVLAAMTATIVQGVMRQYAKAEAIACTDINENKAFLARLILVFAVTTVFTLIAMGVTTVFYSLFDETPMANQKAMWDGGKDFGADVSIGSWIVSDVFDLRYNSFSFLYAIGTGLFAAVVFCIILAVLRFKERLTSELNPKLATTIVVLGIVAAVGCYALLQYAFCNIEALDLNIVDKTVDGTRETGHVIAEFRLARSDGNRIEKRVSSFSTNWLNPLIFLLNAAIIFGGSVVYMTKDGRSVKSLFKGNNKHE